MNDAGSDMADQDDAGLDERELVEGDVDDQGFDDRSLDDAEADYDDDYEDEYDVEPPASAGWNRPSAVQIIAAVCFAVLGVVGAIGVFLPITEDATVALTVDGRVSFVTSPVTRVWYKAPFGPYSIVCLLMVAGLIIASALLVTKSAVWARTLAVFLGGLCTGEFFRGVWGALFGADLIGSITTVGILVAAATGLALISGAMLVIEQVVGAPEPRD